MGEQGYSSTILDLGTKGTSVVSFTPRPLTPVYGATSTQSLVCKGTKADLDSVK
jgi:hypothetical protein